MMISPEGFIEEYKNKSYAELLLVRDELLDNIRALRSTIMIKEQEFISSSPR